MYTYSVEVATGPQMVVGKTDTIFISIVGVQGESPKHCLGDYFSAGTVNYYQVCSQQDLGDLLLVRLYKERSMLIENPWYCEQVTVSSPTGKMTRFPGYLWFCGFMTLEIPEAKGTILAEDLNPILVQQRNLELEQKREIYKWKSFIEGAPHSIDATILEQLPQNEQFPLHKSNFEYSVASTEIELQLKEYTESTDPWADLEDIKKMVSKMTPNSVLVPQMWKEDTFFGYQYLNGPNPVTIKKCTEIPENFPVDQEMVANSFGESTNLQTELEQGNVFVANYKILEDIPPNTINEKGQYLTAPLCLLWKNPEDHLVPIAIQLGQAPGPDNPIFLPNDDEWDWTLAKIWVRNADFQLLQVRQHLLYNHLLAEVFCMATFRQLPMQHPVYKLLVPHLQDTLRIHVLARSQLASPGGLFDQTMAVGSQGAHILLRKVMEDLTFESIFLPDDIHARGMDTIPNYYYRDDGMKIWSATARFLTSIVNYYYKNDDQVVGDAELQAWVNEIYTRGFLGHECTGMPSTLEARPGLIHLMTAVIFICSVQHAVVNGGQRCLGNYPEGVFTEELQGYIKYFQETLAEISKQIQEREKNWELTYLYLDPKPIAETDPCEPLPRSPLDPQ
uniref:Uncharacterized protein n=1 Tax=Leptobrachium leishanense TaxID=445787 RepID=A0A8C5PYT9_9ANUR